MRSRKTEIVSLLAVMAAFAPPIRKTEDFRHVEKEKNQISIAINYEKVLEDINSQRNAFRERFLVSDEYDRETISYEARDFIHDTLVNRIFPAWYGTPWDFNGTTTTPRKGKIACGYFVATTLQQAGFNLNIRDFAIQPSGYIIKNLTSDIKTMHGLKIPEIRKKFRDWGEGIYIAGLDNHVGFVVHDRTIHPDDVLWFVHADYYDPKSGVKIEEIDSENPFADSKYRIIGKLFDIRMMKNWIKRKEFPLEFNYFKRQ